MGGEPVVDEAAVKILPVVRPQVDGGKVSVLAHLQGNNSGRKRSWV